MRSQVGAALAVAVLLGGASCSPPPEAATEAKASVTVAVVERASVAEWVALFGRVAPPPDRDATLAPQVPGVLLAVTVREGDPVQAGEVVARVDEASLRDALAAAEAAERRSASEATFRHRAAERTQGLFEKGVVSRQEAEADQAAAVAADAAVAEVASGLATARRRLAWAELRAPFAGVVVRVLRRAGDMVDGSPATAVVEIAAPWPVQVVADATAEALAVVAPGQRAEITQREGEASPRPAKVVRVARSVDANTGSGEVRLTLDDPRAPLVLGTSVSIRIAVHEKTDVLTIPAAALRHGPDGAAEVVVILDGKAVVRAVTTGLADHERIEIASGLAALDSVVVDDPVGLSDGTAVSIRP